jgi:hypothetical protein
MHLLVGLYQHWLGFVIILYVSVFWFCRHVVFPVEYYFLGETALIASTIFLPHAVRVLSSWLLGPKVLFALIPAEFITHSVWGLQYQAHCSFFIPIFSASSAVLAFEVLRLMGYKVYPNRMTKPNWIGVIMAGMLASVFNSLSGSYLKSEVIATGEIWGVMTRFIIGDITGLILSMLMLMYLFRYLERRTVSPQYSRQNNHIR